MKWWCDCLLFRHFSASFCSQIPGVVYGQLSILYVPLPFLAHADCQRSAVVVVLLWWLQYVSDFPGLGMQAHPSVAGFSVSGARRV